ncbi:hypothetical protein GOODEAATRI_018469, partial [Goodea atripinnis]
KQKSPPQVLTCIYHPATVSVTVERKLFNFCSGHVFGATVIHFGVQWLFSLAVRGVAATAVAPLRPLLSLDPGVSKKPRTPLLAFSLLSSVLQVHREPADCPLHFQQSACMNLTGTKLAQPAQTTETIGDATAERQCGTKGRIKNILFSEEAPMEMQDIGQQKRF